MHSAQPSLNHLAALPPDTARIDAGLLQPKVLERLARNLPGLAELTAMIDDPAALEGPALRLALRYAGVPRYFFACFVHPSAYVSLCRHAPRVWPHPGVVTPPHVEALMLRLRRQFALTPVGPGTVDVGWIARECSSPPRRLSPEARFYLERNPGYRRGEGLMTVIDFGTAAAIEGSLDFVAHRIRRLWRPAGRPQPMTT